MTNSKIKLVVKEGVVVVDNKINGKGLSDYKSSYVMMYLLESTIYDFYKLDNNGKKKLCEKFDEQISNMFSIPRANFVFENKEQTLDKDNIYFGSLDDIETGLEFILRYFFEKRQQYQRLCVFENSRGSFTEENFESIKFTFDRTPISGKFNYIPYSKGLKNYLLNYNKVDALLFAYECFDEVLSIIDFERVSSNMTLFEVNKTNASLQKIKKYEIKMLEHLKKIVASKESKDKLLNSYNLSFDLMESENEFLISLNNFLNNANKNDIDRKIVFFCFNPCVWDNLNETQKKKAVEICNDVIGEILQCETIKSVKFDKGSNSYNFSSNEYVHVGDVNCESVRNILVRLVYENSFNKNYENIFELDDDSRDEMLKQLKDCKDVVIKNGSYKNIKDYHFIKCVRETAQDMQNKIYRYIVNNLVVNGEKIKMPISKEEFVVDLFNRTKKRR